MRQEHSRRQDVYLVPLQRDLRPPRSCGLAVDAACKKSNSKVAPGAT